MISQDALEKIMNKLLTAHLLEDFGQVHKTCVSLARHLQGEFGAQQDILEWLAEEDPSLGLRDCLRQALLRFTLLSEDGCRDSGLVAGDVLRLIDEHCLEGHMEVVLDDPETCGYSSVRIEGDAAGLDSAIYLFVEDEVVAVREVSEEVAEMWP